LEIQLIGHVRHVVHIEIHAQITQLVQHVLPHIFCLTELETHLDLQTQLQVDLFEISVTLDEQLALQMFLHAPNEKLDISLVGQLV